MCLHVPGMLMVGVREESRQRGPLKTAFKVHAGNDLRVDMIKSSNMKTRKDRFALALGTLPVLIYAPLCLTLFKSRSGGDAGGAYKI